MVKATCAASSFSRTTTGRVPKLSRCAGKTASTCRKAAPALERAAAEANAENVFLTLLARFNAQDRNVSDKTGPTYAPSFFAAEPEAKAARLKAPALADAMRRLFAADRIHLELYGKPSRQFRRLVLGSRPDSANGGAIGGANRVLSGGAHTPPITPRGR